MTKTFWKPISANTIFVAEDNVTKRRDYEDQVVKVFYLKNITSVQEFQEIVTAVRSVTDIRRMFTYNAQNAVMCRGTVDQIALAEKLFHDLDKPKSEVVVDVMVMEVNRDRTRNLAAGLTSGCQTGLGSAHRICAAQWPDHGNDGTHGSLDRNHHGNDDRHDHRDALREPPPGQPPDGTTTSSRGAISLVQIGNVIVQRFLHLAARRAVAGHRHR